MDELQARLARLGLDVLAEYGFALAGGYALQAHQLVDRVSEDIDMFTDRWDTDSFAAAINAVSQAFRHHGYAVEMTRQAETFARIQVTDIASGEAASVDLAADYRKPSRWFSPWARCWPKPTPWRPKWRRYSAGPWPATTSTWLGYSKAAATPKTAS